MVRIKALPLELDGRIEIEIEVLLIGNCGVQSQKI